MKAIIRFFKVINPFIINSEWSKDELWWTDVKDGFRLYHLFAVGVVERTLDDGVTYKGMQIIVLWLALCVALKPSARRLAP